MKIMSMARKFPISIRGSVFCIILFYTILGVGCSRESHPLMSGECNLVHMDVLQAIADNPEVRLYAKEHFEAPGVIFLWEKMPSKVQSCGTARGWIKIMRSSSPQFDGRDFFISIDKMYFDDDAAFVEISFPPTGKNGDIFLRKRAGKWVVVEKLLWES